MFCQFTFDSLGIDARLVDFVNGDNDRNLGGLGMRNRFDRLRHDAVIRRDNKHDDVGNLGSARTHQCERLVARRIEERDFSVLHLHLVGADVLRDSAGFLFGDSCLSDGVE